MEDRFQNEKESNFLRWKWGYSGTSNTDQDAANRVLEKTRQELLHMLADCGGLLRMKDAQKEHIRQIIIFENECNVKRFQLGLRPTSAVKRMNRKE